MINIGLWRSTNIILLACDSNLNLFTTALSIGLSTVHLRPFVTLVTSSVSIITSSIPFFITPIFLIHHTVVSFDATVASFDSSLLPSPSPSTLPSSHPVSSPSHPPSPSHFSPSIISVICLSSNIYAIYPHYPLVLPHHSCYLLYHHLCPPSTSSHPYDDEILPT